MNHEKYMKEAIKEAYKGIKQGHGGPFGAVIVKDGKIIARGHNHVLAKNDPTCHGEIEVIRKACKKLKTFDLSGCVLYTTSSPCPMCAGAIQWARISHVYEGCNYDDASDIGFDDKNFFEKPINPTVVNREECLELFQKYKKLKAKKY